MSAYKIPTANLTPTERKRIVQWYEELTSGKHKQCGDRLYDPNTGAMCCLGVYTKEVCGRKPLKNGNFRSKGTPRSDSPANQERNVLPNGVLIQNCCDLPLVVPKNLRHRVPSWEWEESGYAIRATKLNDLCDLTFKQIAACIKETWPELFEGK